jgi:preprotein translocase subunit YajC
MIATLSIFAQQAPATPPPGGGSSMLITMALFFVIFWVMIIRPQRKKQKEDEARRAGLKKGDRVVTIGGVHGVINAVSDRTVSLRIADNVHVTMEKSSVASVLPKEGEAAAAVAEAVKKD